MFVQDLQRKHRPQFLSFFSKHGYSEYQDLIQILGINASTCGKVLMDKATRLLDSQEKGETSILVALKNDKIVGSIIYGERKWDTQHFEFPIGEISNLSTRKSDSLESAHVREALLTKAIHKLESQKIDCVISRIPISQKLIIQAYENNGFLLMDVLVTFLNEKVNKKMLINESKTKIRSYKDSDLGSLMKTAKNVFTYSHFFADPRFPREKCSELYEKWVENTCTGLADKVLVADLNGTPVGFVVLKKDKDAASLFKTNVGIIDLIAVSKDFQRRRIGQDLTLSALRWFNRNQTPLTKVSTQLNNVGGVRLYLGAGFQYLGAEITFHKWI